MEIAFVLGGALVVAAGTVAAALVINARRRAQVDGANNAVLVSVRAMLDEARVANDAGRDQALKSAVDLLAAQNRQTLEAERELGAEALAGKAALIDAQLAQVRTALTAELTKVSGLVQTLERDRAQQFGQLSEALTTQQQSLGALNHTAQQLREALASQKKRGEWGERMAEDVLRLAGFLENVNYIKQTQLADRSGKPDFTFLLPQEQVLHMDVKFPLDSYLRYLEETHDAERARHRDQFLRDVRARVKELASRNYVDVTEGTLDCVLLFIPNESLYAFIQEQDPQLLDDALRSKVVFCSPLTLFAVLAVIRQAVDNFRIERTSNEILATLGVFAKQWNKFAEQMDKVGLRIEALQKEFDVLTTTRQRQLVRQIDKVEALRTQHAIALTEGDDAEESVATPLELR
ncbi:MAG: DNA recombination protein RmuC [Acidimicrobiia bacterium]